MIDVKHWLRQAQRLDEDDAYTYAHLAHDLVARLGWMAAVDVAAALRAHVYGWPGGHPLHQDVRPLYARLGWEQAALVCAWFRNARNRPDGRPKKRPGGWPAATPTTEESR